MKKQGMKKHRKAEEMNGLLTAYDVSGQSVREFCVSQGIAEHLLRYWLKRRSLSVEQAEPTAGGGFTELQVSRGGCVGLVLPGGLRLGLDGLAPRELASLLLELDRQGRA